MTATEGLRIAGRGPVAVATFERPGRANALTLDMQARLTDFFAAATTETAISAVVVTGGSGSVFSAGADVRETAEGVTAEEFAHARSRRMFEMLQAMLAFPKPVVAAVNGHAVGSGCLVALLADARVAAPGASFSLPEIQRGQPTFAGATVVGRLMGDMAAQDLVQTGRRMSCEEAARRGLVTEIAAPEELLPKAEALALALAGQPEAFALNKAWIHQGFAERLAEAAQRSAAVRSARQTAFKGG